MKSNINVSLTGITKEVQKLRFLADVRNRMGRRIRPPEMAKDVLQRNNPWVKIQYRYASVRFTDKPRSS
jgi:hypothetical protein